MNGPSTTLQYVADGPSTTLRPWQETPGRCNPTEIKTGGDDDHALRACQRLMPRLLHMVEYPADGSRQWPP
jgi:hypothetical protein